MPSNIFWGLQHLNGNVLCSVQLDMSMKVNGEIVELCVLPLDHMLKPHKELRLFDMRIAPESEVNFKECRLTRPEVAAAKMRGLDAGKVADIFESWFQSLRLNEGKRIIPLGHNLLWQVVALKEWLGSLYEQIFTNDYRDTLIAAHFVNDRDDARGEAVSFSKQKLRWLCNKFNIEHMEYGGSCLTDCKSIGELYSHLLRSF